MHFLFASFFKMEKHVFTLHDTFKIAMVIMITCIPYVFPVHGMNKILCNNNIVQSNKMVNPLDKKNSSKSILSTSNCISIPSISTLGQQALHEPFWRHQQYRKGVDNSNFLISEI